MAAVAVAAGTTGAGWAKVWLKTVRDTNHQYSEQAGVRPEAPPPRHGSDEIVPKIHSKISQGPQNAMVVATC